MSTKATLGWMGVCALAGLGASFFFDSFLSDPSTEHIPSESLVLQTGNQGNDAILTISEAQRMKFLSTAVDKANPESGACRGERAFYQGIMPGLSAFWDIECSNGRSYQVTISPGGIGNTRVLDCATLGMVKCFVPFP
ncbi:MAG TPA: hypothetical protein VKU19_01720 [Bryobacteraceae bacterium]|nr:hypothetical protein [Bryobacteraceae bacterium]